MLRHLTLRVMKGHFERLLYGYALAYIGSPQCAHLRASIFQGVANNPAKKFLPHRGQGKLRRRKPV